MAKHSLAWASLPVLHLMSMAIPANAGAVNLFLGDDLMGDGKTSRIIGGEKTLDRFPYAVPLHIDGDHFCGGFLIAPNAVLTAAHCPYGETSDITVFIGSDNVNGGTEYDIKVGYEHPLYDYDDDRYDMYVIILDGEVTDIPPVLLNPDPEWPTSGMMSTVMGWGENAKGDNPEELHSVELEVISNEECKASDSDYDRWIFPDMICTLTPGKDSCYGDSGGPVVIESADNDPAKDVAFGIVSWGVGCAGLPGVYARISADIEWIVEKVCVDHDGTGPLCSTETPVPTHSSGPTPAPQPSSSPTSNPTRDESSDQGFDLSDDPSFVPRLVGSSIGQDRTLHMRISCPGPDAVVVPGYQGVRIDWTDLRKAQWELKLDGSDRIAKGDLTSLGNGHYVASYNLADVPLGYYEVKLKLEDNDGNKLEYKEETGSVIDVVEATTKEPTVSPTTSEPTVMPSKAPTAPPTTAAPTPVITPDPTSPPSTPPTAAPSVSPTTSPPTSAPIPSPTLPPTILTCSLPIEGPYILVTADGGCADARERIVDPWEVSLSDVLTIVVHDDGVDKNRLDKFEVEFKVEGDKDRKTKYKLELGRTDGFDANEDFYLRADPTLPYAMEEDGVVYYKLEINVNDIGGIGGNANGDDNEPVQVGEEIEWKFKVEDLDGGVADYTRDVLPIVVVAE